MVVSALSHREHEARAGGRPGPSHRQTRLSIQTLTETTNHTQADSMTTKVSWRCQYNSKQVVHTAYPPVDPLPLYYAPSSDS